MQSLVPPKLLQGLLFSWDLLMANSKMSDRAWNLGMGVASDQIPYTNAWRVISFSPTSCLLLEEIFKCLE